MKSNMVSVEANSNAETNLDIHANPLVNEDVCLNEWRHQMQRLRTKFNIEHGSENTVRPISGHSEYFGIK
jgi:hypothetical protein